MKKLTFVLFAATLFLTTSCVYGQRVTASKNYVTKKADFGNFEGIRLTGSPDVIYTQKEGKPSVEVYTSDNIFPLLDIFVKDGILHVQFKKNSNIQNTGKVEVRVTAPYLTEVYLHGSGDIKFANGMKNNGPLNISVHGSGDIEGRNIECDNLSIRVQGSGDIDLSGVKANSTEANVNGSGDITLKGSSHTASFRVNGSGDIDAEKFEVADLHAEVTGSGDISCWATVTLTGSVRGSGDVGYKGNPEIDFSKKGLRKL